MNTHDSAKAEPKRLGKGLYLQVLFAIVVGALVGHFAPSVGREMKPLADGFIKLIKMLIAPIVFTTVIIGIAGMGDLKKVGRVGLRALVYFEVLTTVALFIGLGVAHLVRPGRGMNVDVAALDPAAVATVAKGGGHKGFVAFLLDVIPDSVVGALAHGEILPVLFFSVLFGVSLAGLGEKGAPVVDLLGRVGKALFGIVGMVMRLAPIGAFGAMSFTVGRYGLGTLTSLGKLMGAFYATSFLFVAVVLALILRLVAGLSLMRLLAYLKDELIVVLGTSSSEAALPRLMDKLEALGCSRGVVGMVVPTGYSFNLDGTAIYLTMAALFVADATNTQLTFGDEMAILGVLLLTSKGAAAVTGGGFITLAATLSSTGTIPVAGLALLLGIDRFMSEARAITNLIGNAVATIVVARWEGELDADKARRALLDGWRPGGPVDDAHRE